MFEPSHKTGKPLTTTSRHHDSTNVAWKVQTQDFSLGKTILMFSVIYDYKLVYICSYLGFKKSHVARGYWLGVPCRIAYQQANASTWEMPSLSYDPVAKRVRLSSLSLRDSITFPLGQKEKKKPCGWALISHACIRSFEEKVYDLLWVFMLGEMKSNHMQRIHLPLSFHFNT